MPDKKSKKPEKGKKGGQKKRKKRSKKRSKPARAKNVAATATSKSVKRSLSPKSKPASRKKISKGKTRSPAPQVTSVRRSKTKSKSKIKQMGRPAPPPSRTATPKVKPGSKSFSTRGLSVRKENKVYKEKESPPSLPRLPEEQVETILIAPDDYLPIYSYKAPPKRTTAPKAPKTFSAVSKRDNPDPRPPPNSLESTAPPAEAGSAQTLKVRYTEASSRQHASNRSKKANDDVDEVGENNDENEDEDEEEDEDEDVVEVNSSDDGGED